MRDHLSPLMRPAADPTLAAIFRTMRTVVGGSEVDVARRLGTDVAVIMDLEAGLIDALPPWPQTSRMIERYGALAGVDVTAVLSAMARMQPPPPPRELALAPITSVTRPQPAPMPQAGPPRTQPASQRRLVAPPAHAAPRPATPVRQRLPALLARAPRWSQPAAIGLGACLLVYGALWVAPRPLYALASVLPGPIDMPFRGMADAVVHWFAPTQNGLKMIDLADPRVRKSDRLDIQRPAKR
jgi:hypothetical protein